MNDRNGKGAVRAAKLVRGKVSKTVTAQAPEELAQALGLSGIESQEWQVQHALLKRLRQIIRVQGLTHAELARRGRSSRTRVTSILNGNLDNVSSDLLIRLLGAVGYRVTVSVSRMDSAAERRRANLEIGVPGVRNKLHIRRDVSSEVEGVAS